MSAAPLVTTGFTADSTADDVVAGLDLAGLRAVVTGASSGLGRETARALAAAGADVTLAVRDTGAGAEAAGLIAAATGNDAVRAVPLDLADPATIARLVDAWDGPLQLSYGQSKTANCLFAVEATRRWAGDGIVANAVNPGGVATGLQRDFTPAMHQHLDRLEAAGVFAWKSVERGAATTLVAATAPEFARTGGHYLDDGAEAPTVDDDADLARNSHAVKRWALDPAAARRLWTVSAAMTGLDADGATGPR